jgi:lipopolysaccharide/colanic/teichoic acid biosynthesis glycosyltransferase
MRSRSLRALDLALLLPSLPFFAAVTAVLAGLVWALDGRPIFFRQPRVGLRGRMFFILKLRTMTTEPEVSARRVTPLGKFLRQRGLDELPQLFNVRPLEPQDVSRLTQKYAGFAARLQVPPGITGLSQVCQAQGAEVTARLDAEYAARANPIWDVELLLRTVYINVVGKRRGAMRPPRAAA